MNQPYILNRLFFNTNTKNKVMYCSLTYFQDPIQGFLYTWVSWLYLYKDGLGCLLGGLFLYELQCPYHKFTGNLQDTVGYRNFSTINTNLNHPKQILRSIYTKLYLSVAIKQKPGMHDYTSNKILNKTSLKLESASLCL